MGGEIQKIDTRLRIYILTYYKVIWEIDIDPKDHLCNYSWRIYKVIWEIDIDPKDHLCNYSWIINEVIWEIDCHAPDFKPKAMTY